MTWPRYMEWSAGIIDAGLEDSFFLGGFSCCIKAQMREGIEGRLKNEPVGG